VTDRSDKCCSNNACGDAIGSVGNATGLNGSLAEHGVAQVPIHSHVAFQGTGVVNVHIADMAVY
jgi:hypothetical protein